MKKTMKTVALAMVVGTLGMAGSAMAAPYRGAQIRHVPNLTHHVGRGYGAARQGWSPSQSRRNAPQSWGNRSHRGQGWSSNPIKRPNPQGWSKTQHHRRQPMPPIRKAPGRQGRFRLR